jgi:hypothetical protein
MSDGMYEKMMGSADPESAYARGRGAAYGPPRSVREVARVVRVCPECGRAFDLWVPVAEVAAWRGCELECGECARVRPEDGYEYEEEERHE